MRKLVAPPRSIRRLRPMKAATDIEIKNPEGSAA
jgi:hypothetical protein